MKGKSDDPARVCVCAEKRWMEGIDWRCILVCVCVCMWGVYGGKEESKKRVEEEEVHSWEMNQEYRPRVPPLAARLAPSVCVKEKRESVQPGRQNEIWTRCPA